MRRDSASINEILKEAEEALNRIEAKSSESAGKAKPAEKSIKFDENGRVVENEEDILEEPPKPKEEKTTVLPKMRKKEATGEKTTVVPNVKETPSEKTTVVPSVKETPSEKTTVVPNVKETASEKTTVVPNVKETANEKTTVVPNVKETANEKTTVVPNVKKGTASQKTAAFNPKRHKYFKTNSTDEEYNKTPPKIIEKSATIKSKSRFDSTSDLQEIPTILAVEELDHTSFLYEGANEKAEENNDYDESAQIKLAGFDDEVDVLPTINEEEAEKILKERREEKVNKFRLFANEEAPETIEAEKHHHKKENTEVTSELIEKLKKKQKHKKVQIIVTAVAGILLLATTLLYDTQYLPSFLTWGNAYFIAELVLWCIVVGANIDSFLHGFNFKHGINFDTPVSLTTIIVTAYSALLIYMPDLAMEGMAIYSSAAAFGLFLSALGKHSELKRTVLNAQFIIDSDKKYTVEEIVNEVDANIISRNILIGEPVIKFSVETDTPTSFSEISAEHNVGSRIARVVGTIMFVLNIALFAYIYITNGDLLYAITVFVAGIVVSCPTVSLFAANNALVDVSNRLSEKGAMVCGYEGANVTHNSNAIVMEAADLFGAHSCDLHGIKTFNGTKVDDAILQTAAVIIKTESPLAKVFDDVIIGKESILPEVDGITYEDKMGTSAWIYQKKILVGNRDILIHHGVAVPKIEFEQKYTRKGRKALYLAVAGKLSAMFVVSYSGDKAIKKGLKRLEKSGITILLRSYDPYINEESLAEIFDLPEGFIRVMTSSNARVFEKYSKMKVEKSPAYTMHNGTALGFISAIRGAECVVQTETLISILVSIGSSAGFIINGLLALFGTGDPMNGINLLLFQVLWCVLILIITKLKRLSL